MIRCVVERMSKFDPAVAMAEVIPVDELGDPLTSLVLGGKWLAGGIRPRLNLPKQRFRVRVVIADTQCEPRTRAPTNAQQRPQTLK